MLAKNNHLFLVLTAISLLALLGLFSLPVHASAAPQFDSAPNTCLTCHEDLYYLHDSGCWYCFTAHKDRCAGCHEGNPATMQEEKSHTGLIAHPQENNGEKCLECHTPQKANLYLTKFEATAGFDTIIKADAYIPSGPVKTGFSDAPKVNSLLENWGWLAAACALFAFWLALMLFSPLKP